jgi:AAA family ATP:ADP antiporter
MVLPRPLRALWGDLTSEEIKKFLLLSATFFCIVGTYWMLRVMKDGIFNYFVDLTYQPRAKMISILVVVLAVAFYGKLVDLLRRKTLFYTILFFYGVCFLAMSYLMLNPYLVYGFQSMISGFVPGGEAAILGWGSYLLLESFGSIVIGALFWAIVASTTTAESAKRGYGMIMSLGQVGTILGTGLVMYVTELNSQFLLFGVGGLILCAAPFFIGKYFALVQEVSTPASVAADKKPKTGMLEGLRLLMSHGYLLGIFVVGTFYEVVGTVVEYQMNMCAKVGAANAKEASELITWFKCRSGFVVGWLAFVFALVGTSFFMRRFGLRFCLVAFPTMIGLVMVGVFCGYHLGIPQSSMVWVFLVAVVIFKALAYALNNPTKEVMYIPTSKDAKFKAKSWIDAFGNRVAKGAGAGINDGLTALVPKESLVSALLNIGTVISLGIVGFWIVVAMYVGNKFNQLQKDGTIIE